jgi:hypothetical protein
VWQHDHIVGRESVVGSATSLPIVPELLDVEEIVGPSGSLLHVDQIVDGRHEEGALIDGGLPGVLG